VFFAGLAAAGLEYEAGVYDLLSSLEPGCVRVDPKTSAVAREAATVAAMAAGAPRVISLGTRHCAVTRERGGRRLLLRW